MDKNIIMNSILFEGFSEKEIEEVLKALDMRKGIYGKEEIIYHVGEHVDRLGLVISGSVRIESVDFDGKRSIMGQIGHLDVFAEAYAYLENQLLLVDAVTDMPCEILFLRVSQSHLRKLQGNSWLPKFQENLLRISNLKSFQLFMRNLHTSSRSVRERVTSFLSTQAIQQGKNKFKISFDRQKMADYLNIDRSALSRELGRMQEEGIIKYKKNSFEIMF